MFKIRKASRLYRPPLAFKTRLTDTLRLLFTVPLFEKYLVSNSSSSWSRKLAPPPYLYNIGAKRFVERNGLFYSLEMSDLLDWQIYYRDRSDCSWDAALSIVKEPTVVIDAGANIGRFALEAARRFPTARVYAFEPFPGNYARLLENVRLNPGLSVQARDEALGDSSGRAGLSSVTPFNSGMTTLVPGGNAVRVVTVDALLDEAVMPRVDFLKIDVEGFELKVLKGAFDTIRKWRPFILIEVISENLQRFGDSPADVEKFFREQDYKTVDARTLRPITITANMYADIICIPNTISNEA